MKEKINCMLAHNYRGDDPAGWWMSEKLDGVRAIWTGTALMSRNGNRFCAPAWWTASLPRHARLDGELFIARGQFQRTVSIVRTATGREDDWKAISYCVFDTILDLTPFEDRLDALLALSKFPVAVVKQTRCRNRKHLEEFTHLILDQGGEGTMLRASGSLYEPRRSHALLKYKAPSLRTEEAVVIGHEPGEGKHAGRLGALSVRWNRKLFRVGTGLSDSERESPPERGEHVTFRFQGVTDEGIPRFPVFVSVRNYE